MAGLFGLLGNADTDREFVNTLGQRVVYDAIQIYLDRVNADLQAAMAVFIEAITEDFKERYKLPGGGRLQRRGGLARSGAVKAGGSWDVAYPIEDFGAQIAASDVDMAYMTIGDLERHLATITIQNTNTVRFEILRLLFNATAHTFTDDYKGDLTIQRLANGDSVVYPPVLGSESEATDTHYLESGYAATAISDTNNPYITIRNELEEHFGASTGGDNIAVFIHPDELPETEALTDYVPVVDSFVRAGDNTAVPINLPSVPGAIRGRVNGCWVVEWRWMTSAYMHGTYLDAPAPLKMRVDPASVGLPRGLALVAREEAYPMESSEWRHRFGVGVGNRLNGVTMELGTGGSYSVPAAYS